MQDIKNVQKMFPTVEVWLKSYRVEETVAFLFIFVGKMTEISAVARKLGLVGNRLKAFAVYNFAHSLASCSFTNLECEMRRICDRPC